VRSPTLLRHDDRRARIVQEETFGPVVVIQPADGLADAVDALDAVPQGLLGAVCTSDPGAVREVLDRIHVGLVQVGGRAPAIHPDAPFGGWKASGIGPPEHGEWDAQLLTRVQAVYDPER
jgi:acyl-CoA reductase-like NAD-dependent aldehyde dehydrogenase